MFNISMVQIFNSFSLVKQTDFNNHAVNLFLINTYLNEPFFLKKLIHVTILLYCVYYEFIHWPLFFIFLINLGSPSCINETKGFIILL